MILRNSSGPTVKAFCVGQARSGTLSLCGLLAKNYRVAHEPEREQILEMIQRESRGEVDEQALRAYLIKRDRRLNLEYDISFANQFLIGHLLTAFPDARFVVLIRDPYTWLQSTIGYLITREIPPDLRSFLDWWFKPERFPHMHHDHGLEAHGVYSIAALLNTWKQHADMCARIIPPDRRLFLRTHELYKSHRQISDFLKIPLESLDTRYGHLNRSTWTGQIESLVGSTYLNDMVVRICGDTMARHFPEVAGLEDASKLWEAVLWRSLRY